RGMANARALTSASFMLRSGRCSQVLGIGCSVLGESVARASCRASQAAGRGLSVALAAARRPVDLDGVAPHLQAYEHLDIAWIASCLRGGDATLAQGGLELRPLLFQLVMRAFQPDIAAASYP